VDDHKFFPHCSVTTDYSSRSEADWSPGSHKGLEHLCHSGPVGVFHVFLSEDGKDVIPETVFNTFLF